MVSADDDVLARARAVKQAHEDDLMALPNVVAVGIGLRGDTDDEPAIIVSVVRKVPLDDLASADRIPGDIEGVPVEVQETGPLVAGG